MDKKRSFEDKLVVIRYTESDYEAEGDAVLLYRVTNGRAVPVYGVLDLPDGVMHNLYYEQVDHVIQLILELGEQEVYSPWMGSAHTPFFGQTLGYFDITDDGECWGELHDLSHAYEDRFVASQIKVRYLNPETYEVME